MTKSTTSPGSVPRPPTPDERRQLADHLADLGYDREDAELTADIAYAAVFDRYVTDCPGYAGKVMCVVWSGMPSAFDVFYWPEGQFVRSPRENDSRECMACGLPKGTLCLHCWRAGRREYCRRLFRDGR